MTAPEVCADGIGDIECLNGFETSQEAAENAEGPVSRPGLGSSSTGTGLDAVPTVGGSSMWGPVASSPESHRLGRNAMTTTTSTAVVVCDLGPVDLEHVALAGFLGGYRGLNRDAGGVRGDRRCMTLAVERGHRTQTVLRKGGKTVTMPSLREPILRGQGSTRRNEATTRSSCRG